MPLPTKHPRFDHAPAFFENLEERLLLTTLYAGDFFIYHNAAGDNVRVELQGAGVVELMAMEDDQLVDLVGLHNGNPANPVEWPASVWPGGGTIVTFNPEAEAWEWTEWEDEVPDDPQTTEDEFVAEQRGSRTEIFAIYFAEADSTTVLSITTLETDQPEKPGEGAYLGITPWDATAEQLPTLATEEPEDPEEDPNIVRSPEGSGGVLVGGAGGLEYEEDEEGGEAGEAPERTGTPTYSAVGNTGPVIAAQLGMFPGGNLYPGISVSDSIATILPGADSTSLGTIVEALAIDSNGAIYGANLEARLARLLPDQSTGGIGTDVDSLASDGSGGFYAADNAGIGVGVIVSDGSAGGLGSDVHAIATNPGGLTYAVDEGSNSLVRVDTITGAPETIGTLRDLNQVGWQYNEVTSLDFNPATGSLYGIGTISGEGAPEGQFLIVIDRTQGLITQTYAITALDPVTSDELVINAIAFDGAGNLFGVARNADNDTDLLFAINAGTGAATYVADISILGINSIEFIGGQMYGISGTRIYRIDGAGNATEYLNPALTGTTSLTYHNGTFYTTVEQDGVYRLARVYVSARLTTIDANGAVAGTSPMVDPTRNLAYVNIHAFGTDTPGGTLYGVSSVTDLDPTDANPAAAGIVLFTCNPATGTVTEVVPIVGTTGISSIAFDRSGTLYGVDSVANQLVTISQATGVLTIQGALAQAFEGITFVPYGTADALFGVTASTLYAIDPATAATTLLQNTGGTGLGSLSYDPTNPNILYTTEFVTGEAVFRVAQISLSSQLFEHDGDDTITWMDMLIDNAEPDWAFDNVHALDFDSSDTLWGVGSVIDLDPYNGPAAPAGMLLINIDLTDGSVQRVAALGVADLTTVAFDTTDVLWGLNPATNELVTVDTVTGAVTPVTIVALADITGMDWQDGVLYATAGAGLYTVDPATGNVDLVDTVDVPGLVMTGLANDPTSTTDLYAVGQFNGQYQLIRLANNIELARRDVDRIIVGGTIAGNVRNSLGDMDVIEAGFLWGEIYSGSHLGDVILMVGGNGMPGGEDEFHAPDNGLIKADGTIRGVYSMGGTLYAGVEAMNRPEIDSPTAGIAEMEYKLWPGEKYPVKWLQGNLVDVNNDTMANAQFVSHPSGNFTITGEFPGLASPSESDDWYALPLLAGQTVTLEGSSFYYIESLRLYDAFGNWMDSWGYETLEDYGIGSRGRFLKPITFTAPAGGVYYLQVHTDGSHIPGTYSVYVTNGTNAELGAVRTLGDFYPRFIGTAGNLDASVGVGFAGDIGAVSATGNVYQADIKTTPTGNIVAVEGGDFPHFDPNGSLNTPEVNSGGYVGGVYSHGREAAGDLAALPGDLSASILAGTGAPGDYDIHNVFAAGTIRRYYSISATGNIGVIRVLGSVHQIGIQPDSDGSGGGRVDLIDVGGDWGAMPSGWEGGVPVLWHGVGGDFGYIHVGGSIYASSGGGITVLDPIVCDNGGTETLSDDGGGDLTIRPGTVRVVDENGDPTVDEDGNEIFHQTTYSFVVIPVDGSTGGVVANLTADGPATLEVNGVVHIGDLDISPNAPDDGTVTSKLTINGSGEGNVYYLHSDAAVDTFINKTPGGLVSGLMQDVDKIALAGSLGARSGSTEAWLSGLLDADPEQNEELEGEPSSPLFGWFAGKINGLAVNGSLGELSVDGWLGDLRVSGTAGTINVNDDDLTAAGDWDGVAGVIWVGGEGTLDSLTFDPDNPLDIPSNAGTSLWKVYVGDGLADDGGGGRPKAGIFVDGTLGGVYVDGPRFEIENQVFGELNGSIIATTNNTMTIEVEDAAGETTTTTRRFPGIGEVIGTSGANLTALVIGGHLDIWQPYIGRYTRSSSVGTVDFSGPGSQIFGSEIAALLIDTVTTSPDSNGMTHVTIKAANQNGHDPSVGEVSAGGPGMTDVNVAAQEGNIGVVRGNSPVADMTACFFNAANRIEYVGARAVTATTITAPGTLAHAETTMDFWDNIVRVGSIDSLEIGRDLRVGEIYVAGLLDKMTVGRDFLDAQLRLQGPTVANLDSLVVERNISGEITSAGRIGEIISRTGAITADIQTLANGWNSDVEKIQVAQGYTGTLQVAGSLGQFITPVSLGSNPETNGGRTQTFDVWGDVDKISIGPRSATAHSYANWNVGGNIDTIDVGGTYYSTVATNGSLDQFIVHGAFGGMLDLNGDGIDETRFGSLDVMGNIGRMQFPTTQDMFADLTVGGSLDGLSMKGGSIVGNIASRYGSMGRVSLTNGTIVGNLTAKSFEGIQVRTAGNAITGNVNATDGDIASLRVTGNVTGDVTATGWIDRLDVSGDLDGTVTAGAGMGLVYIRNGDLNGDLLSDGPLGRLQIRGSDIFGMVSVEAGIDQITLDGNVTGTVIRAAHNIDRLSIGGNVDNSIISAGWNVTDLSVRGSVINDSHVLAGYDVGPDGIIGTADDFHGAGNIDGVSITGVLNASVLSAGISPGVDADFRTTLDNDPGDVINAGLGGDGISWITDVSARGGYVGNNWALAETGVEATFAAALAASGGTVWIDVPAFVPGGGPLPVGPLTISLTGDGTATYQANWAAGVDRVVLNDTNDSSRLTIAWTGGGAYGNTIRIDGEDDAGLNRLTVTGDVDLDDVAIDGLVDRMSVQGVDAGSTWVLPGGVGQATLAGGMADVNVTAGEIGSWRMGGAYDATVPTTFTAYVIGSFQTAGDVDADMIVLMGGIGRFNVGGNLDGDVELNDETGQVSIDGDATGILTVHYGDLSRMTVGRDLTGRVNVERGAADRVSIGRDFGVLGADESSFRALREVGSFTSGRNFYGVLATHGDMGKLSARNGAMRGRAWAGGNVKSFDFGSMEDGLLAASGNVAKGRIAADMTDSYIFSGFNPGDAGYDALNGGEAANVQIDAWTNALWRNANNADHAQGGSLGSVAIGGNMTRSTISGAVDPGTDGYVGTSDDIVGGVGYVTRVSVGGAITGDANPNAAYGVYAVSNMPSVTHYGKRPFEQDGNARVDSMQTIAGNLRVTGVYVGYNWIEVTFNHPLNATTLDTTVFRLEASVDFDFDTLIDNTDVTAAFTNTLELDNTTYTVTLTFPGTSFEDMGVGNYMRVYIEDTLADIRGNLLDGEYLGILPSGDDAPGGDFVYLLLASDMPADFEDASAATALSLPADNGTQYINGSFTSEGDIDIISFTGDAYDFFSAQFFGPPLATMGVFLRDDQGTPLDTSDDTFEALARWENKDTSIDTLFEAFELPETGEYFVAIAPDPAELFPLDAGTTYGLGLTMSSSDTQLLADLGGVLPLEEEIPYASNTIGDNNNDLGANYPKQLVYLDFDGGTATKYQDLIEQDVDVEALDLTQVSPWLAGQEDVIINGGAGVTGIVDNVISIFTNTPATHPLGTLNVQRIDVGDAGDWAAYLAATEGLYFTTVDPAAARALDPETDFTTVFIGQADDSLFSATGIVFGVASTVDVANQSKADNGLVFAQNFSIYDSVVTPGDMTAQLNEYSIALANTTAHELGHTLGLNHQPTTADPTLIVDDPNNDGDTSDSNTGLGLMGYPQALTDRISNLLELGTADLASAEFPVGQIDTMTSLLRWLS